MNKTKQVIIVGAGPSGLTAAYELQKKGYKVYILEKESEIGGLCKTIEKNGFRIDTGGHRLFTENHRVLRFWEEFAKESCDSMTEKTKLLRKSRKSVILFDGNQIDYPIRISKALLRAVGWYNILPVIFGYLRALVFKREERSLEDYYINHFGKPLYQLFFKEYTKKVCGKEPSLISSDWGRYRVKSVSLIRIVLHRIKRRLPLRKRCAVERSLSEEYLYPEMGIGDLWVVVSNKIQRMGGNIILDAKVTGIKRENGCYDVEYEKNGCLNHIEAICVFSSMPLKNLVNCLDNVPNRIKRVASQLQYRSFIEVGIVLDRNELGKCHDVLGINRNQWIYVHQKGIALGRIQIYNNWSPRLIDDPNRQVLVGLEFFCNYGDAFWGKNDESIISIAVTEMKKLRIISNRKAVVDSIVVREKNAYPSYYGAYRCVGEVRKYIDSIENLFCIGRNGLHQYINIDESMMTAFNAVNKINHTGGRHNG